jgi:hypothetical protein
MWRVVTGRRGAVLLALLLSVVSHGEASDPVQGERLFRITRNKNDNIVCYDVLQQGGKLGEGGPVSVYWIIPSRKNALEGLTFFERRRA